MIAGKYQARPPMPFTPGAEVSGTILEIGSELRQFEVGQRVLVIGFASGEIPALPANLPLLKGSSVVGVFWGSFTQREPEAHQINTSELLELITNDQLKPHISDQFDLSHAAQAISTLAGRRALGKIVINIA